MFFNDYLMESEDLESADIDAVISPVTPDTDAEAEIIAGEVEKIVTDEALEAAQYFDGGKEAVREFYESPEMQAYIEAFGPFGANKKNTFVRMSRKDDLQRRTHLACLLLAKNHKDPLFTKLANNRIKERALRKQIFDKYEAKASHIAMLSQKKSIQNKKRFKLPFFAKKDDTSVDQQTTES